ncbi:MAG TPA: alpha/beta hydrolase [Methylococcaceae bacterium]|nr:alpha/beta hydrolase [Methylococcaceae bacterium]
MAVIDLFTSGATSALPVTRSEPIECSNVLILPGYGGSGPRHWQTLWETTHPRFRRVNQRDWQFPVCREWVETLEREVARTGGRSVLVAHSLACLTVAHWAATSGLKIRSALLVAPPDPESPHFPQQASGFHPIPLRPFTFKSIVVASSNDPYGSIGFARRRAEAWDAEFVDAGPIGHINSESRLGHWPYGFSLLKMLLTQAD